MLRVEQESALHLKKQAHLNDHINDHIIELSNFWLILGSVSAPYKH